MSEIKGPPLNQEAKESNYGSIKLISLKGERQIEAILSTGEVLGEGESGVVREAWLEFTRNGKKRKYPVVIKTYRQQDEDLRYGKDIDPKMAKARNDAYRGQLFYYECLRRVGVNVIPTFRLAQGEGGNILGIVMTNLNIKPLDAKSEVVDVSTTKTDTLASQLTSFSRRRDLALAKKIGLGLEHDSWMLQYSNRWKGLGLVIPQPVVSDIIGVKIEDKHLFNEFLSQADNEDLKEEAVKNWVLKLKLV